MAEVSSEADEPRLKMRRVCLQHEEAMQRSTLEIGLGLGIEVCGLAGARINLRLSNTSRICEELIIFLMKLRFKTSNEKASGWSHSSAYNDKKNIQLLEIY